MSKKPTGHPRGRPELYNSELGIRICTLIAEGMPLTKICKMEDMPCYATVLTWLCEDSNFKSDFSAMYEKARRDQADTLADEIIEIADEAKRENVMAARLRVDARKWVAAKLKPRKYGDRTEVVGAGGTPLGPQVVFYLPENGRDKPDDDDGSDGNN